MKTVLNFLKGCQSFTVNSSPRVACMRDFSTKTSKTDHQNQKSPLKLEGRLCYNILKNNVWTRMKIIRFKLHLKAVNTKNHNYKCNISNIARCRLRRLIDSIW